MSARAKVDLDAIAEKCQALQPTHVAECLPELVEEAVREDLPPIRFLDVALERENVLFLGPPGVGKSHLAVALGVKAVKNGFSATHFVLDDLLHQLRGDAAVPPARLKAKRYLNRALLIIDAPGFRHLDRHEANLFFRFVSYRYERGSIILTSNKHVRHWPEIFAGDEILTPASPTASSDPRPQKPTPKPRKEDHLNPDGPRSGA